MHPGSRRHSFLLTQRLAHPEGVEVPTTLGRIGNCRHPSRGELPPPPQASLTSRKTNLRCEGTKVP